MPSEYTVALTAAVLAAAAFLVASFQAFLEYISSGSARYKATAAAIGPSAAHSKWRWSASDWKLKVYYPLLNFHHRKIWKLASLARETSAYQEYWSSTKARMKKTPGRVCGWKCVDLNEVLTRWTVTDGMDVLYGTKRNGENGLITFADLDWRGRFLFIRYRLSHWWTPVKVPRASWAQLLNAFGIRDTSDLVLSLNDVDTVHTMLDAPTQRVSLRQLGHLALSLGFTSVSIDVENRTFTALGPHGTITTEEISTVGKIIRFDGNTREIYRITNHEPSYFVSKAANLIRGNLNFGAYQCNGLFWPLHVLRDAIMETWESEKYDELERKAMIKHCDTFEAGPLYREGRIFKESLEELVANTSNTSATPQDPLQKEPCEVKALQLWKKQTGSAIPTVYAAAAFSPFSPIICGFPSERLLLPFLPRFRHRARELRHSPHIQEDYEFRNIIRHDDISFANTSTEYYMNTSVFNPGINGLCGWGMADMSKISSSWTDEELQFIDPANHRDGPKAMMSPEITWLLEDFDPVKWSHRISQVFEEAAWFVRTQNLVWIHLVTIDRAIQHILLNGSNFQRLVGDLTEEETTKMFEKIVKSGKSDEQGIWDLLIAHIKGEVWGVKEAQVVHSIVEAWRPSNNPAPTVVTVAGTPTTQLGSSIDPNQPGDLPDARWALAEELEKNLNILEADLIDPEKRKAKCAKLADLLEIRAMLIIAYLLLHPDSTDIVTTESFDIEMPMV